MNDFINAACMERQARSTKEPFDLYLVCSKYNKVTRGETRRGTKNSSQRQNSDGNFKGAFT